MKKMRTQFYVVFLSVFAAGILSAHAADESCNANGCHADLFKKKVLHEPFTDDCESCHEANGNKHPITGGNEFALTDAVPDLCYQCHDEQNTMENIHPPVDDGECLSCHSPHSSNLPGLIVESESGNICLECHDLELAQHVHNPVKDNKCTSCHEPHQSANELLLKHQSPDLCLSCHKAQAEEMENESVHPAFEEDCLNCHRAHSSEKEQLLTKEVPQLCTDCHELDMTAENLHPPAEDGECLTCHSAHSSQQGALFKKDACMECHEFEQKGKFTHQPVADGNCAGCHEPHASANATFLKAEGPQLCFACHDKVQKLADLSNVHPPFEDDCLGCHQPHFADNKQLLNRTGSDLCMECHDNGAVVDSTRMVHGGIRRELPCNSCHTAHATNQNALLLNEDTELCLTCHNKEIAFHKREIVNIANLIQNAESVHPPVEDDGCTTCHQVHNETYPFLLTSAFPAGNYSTEGADSYALCFDCHDQEIILEKETTQATDFRNGKQNLHYLHVNREKSRSCINCHDAHGSEQETLISKDVPFGKWKMHNIFTRTTEGGSCLTGCHEEKTYKR